MNTGLLRFFIFFLVSFAAVGSSLAQQIVTLVPAFATAEDNNVSVIYDASQGSAGLLNESTIYAHTGVITSSSTSSSDWKYVIASWTTNLPKALLTRVGSSNQYTLNIGNIRAYYGVPAGEKILKLAFVFRNASGSKTGKTTGGGDIFLDVNQGVFQVKFQLPAKGSFYNTPDTVVTRAASSKACNMHLYANGILLDSIAQDSLLNNKTIFSAFGTDKVVLVVCGTAGTDYAADTTYIVKKLNTVVMAPPAGIKDGINYVNDSTVTLQLFAPYKNYVYVVGDFNQWEYSPEYFMYKSTDSSRFWITLHGLTPGKEYGFQYSIDSIQMKVADIYAGKVLDPYNDKYISAATYPNLMPYPTGKTTEVVSVLQTAAAPYAWNDKDYKKPAQEKLVVYELLLRDFIGTHDFKTLRDTISYFKRTGINCVELMPVMEFEGNESWGYNPMFYFAPDKYYGTAHDLKAFVDACHQNNIAVVFDIALNHSFGQNPQVRMYFNAAAGQWGQPTAENPWFNQTDRHPYSVGYDYNHEAKATQEFTDRVLHYWINEFHADGYRFDLSKGFTQKYTFGDVAGWSAYDQSRINNLSRIGAAIRSYAPDAYLILEHLGDNNEEKVLADSGFVLWGKMTDNYAEALMGYNNSKADLSWGNYKSRGFTKPNLITYAESHDEERVMYSCLTYGNANANYSSKDLNTALNRAKTYHAFLLLLRGPKMLWQGGEMGYEVSINSTTDKTASKPFRWSYLGNAQRVSLLENVAELARLKQHVSFTSSDYNYQVNGTAKVLRVNHDSMNTLLAGNFDIVLQNIPVNFQHTGWWYNFYTGDSLLVLATAQSLAVAPGNHILYTDKNLKAGAATGLYTHAGESLKMYPNPVGSGQKLYFEGLGAARFQISDMEGRLVFESSIGSNQKEIQLPQTLKAGLYIYMLQTDGAGQSGKLVVE